MTNLKYLLLTIVVATSFSSCLIDDILSIPYGTHELKAYDFTEQSFFRPEYYSGDGIITDGECETYTYLMDPDATPVELCFPEGGFLRLNSGQTFELEFHILFEDEFIPQSLFGSFSYGDNNVLLEATQNFPLISVSYDNDELKMNGNNQLKLIFERE